MRRGPSSNHLAEVDVALLQSRRTACARSAGTGSTTSTGTRVAPSAKVSTSPSLKAVFVLLVISAAVAAVVRAKGRGKALHSKMNSSGMLAFSLSVLMPSVVLGVLFLVHLALSLWHRPTMSWTGRWPSSAPPSLWLLSEILRLSVWHCTRWSNAWRQSFAIRTPWPRPSLRVPRLLGSWSKPPLPIRPLVRRWTSSTPWSFDGRYWLKNKQSVIYMSVNAVLLRHVSMLPLLHVLLVMWRPPQEVFKLCTLTVVAFLLDPGMHNPLLAALLLLVKWVVLQELQDWCATNNQRFEFWMQIKEFRTHLDQDAASEAPSDLGDEEQHLVELEQLKKRSIDAALTPDDLDKLEKLMQKQSQIKAAKRLRTVRDGAAASFNR
ncbi:unnamed protein product, partial [Prorocentrum cordatum]